MSHLMKKTKTKESTKIQKAKVKQAYSPLGIKAKMHLLGVFLLLSFCLYFQSLSFGYVLDDKLVYTENTYVKEGFSGIGKILTTESFQGYFGKQMDLVQGARYRPLSLVSFSIEHELAGLSSGLSHFLNVLFYGLAAFICFITLRRLFNEKSADKKLIYSISFISALIFLVHPIHVEAVANVKGRDEILALLFSMLTLWAALKYTDTRKVLLLIMVPILYLLGMLSKENTITFLAIIPAAIIVFRKHARAANMKVFFSLLISTIAYLVYRNYIIGYLLGGEPSNDLMNNSFLGMSSLQKYATIFYTLLIYLKLNIIPHPLTHDYYPYHIPIMNFGNWQVWLSILLHLALVGLMIVSYKRRKKLSYAIFFYIAAMSIVSNLVISIGTFMNERFAFVASLGICMILAYLIKAVAKKTSQPHRLTLVLAGLLLFLYGFKTMTRVPAWESELTLNQAAIKVSKNSARANSFMATALFNKYKNISDATEKKRLLAEAQPYAKKAVAIHPSYYNGHLMSCGIAAERYKYDRDLDKLLAEFKQVTLARPDVEFLQTYLDYLNGRADKATLMAYYKDICINGLMNQQRKYSWALKFLKLASALDPNDAEIRQAIRTAYSALGQNPN